TPPRHRAGPLFSHERTCFDWVPSGEEGACDMTLASLTITFSDLALQIIAGAIAAGAVGRAFRGGGFGILGDLLIGAIGAVVANFIIGYFELFDITRYGLVGELIVAVVGAILVVVIVRLFTTRRTARTEA